MSDNKRDRRANIARAKDQLLAKRYSQIVEEDFLDVFELLIRYLKIRLVPAFGARHCWKRAVVIIKNAFVDAEITEELYVIRAKGFENGEEGDYECISKMAL